MAEQKVALITGANRGIGLSLCANYLAQGFKVYALCRNSSAELDVMRGSDLVILSGIDVAQPESFVELSQRISVPHLDIVINNAGILRDEVMGRLNFSSIDAQFQTNALGPLRIVESLLGKLGQGSKLAFITSRMGSIADNTSGGRYGYRMSKAALNIAAMSMSHDLRSAGVSVGIYHPGLVGTDMIGGYGDVTPEQAAANLVKRIDALSLETSGDFYHANGERLPW